MIEPGYIFFAIRDDPEKQAAAVPMLFMTAEEARASLGDEPGKVWRGPVLGGAGEVVEDA